MVKADQVVEEFLRQTLVGVISTIDKKGRPRTAPIWFHWENGSAYMFTDRGSLKWRNILRNPYASLCVDWREHLIGRSSLTGWLRKSTGRCMNWC